MSGCSGHNEDSRSVVYEDMQASFEQAGLRSSNIGIFSKTEKDGSVSYGEYGSGVIIRRQEAGCHCGSAAPQCRCLRMLLFRILKAQANFLFSFEPVIIQFTKKNVYSTSGTEVPRCRR